MCVTADFTKNVFSDESRIPKFNELSSESKNIIFFSWIAYKKYSILLYNINVPQTKGNIKIK